MLTTRKKRDPYRVHKWKIHDKASMEDLGLDNGDWDSKLQSKPKCANPQRDNAKKKKKKKKHYAYLVI